MATKDPGPKKPGRKKSVTLDPFESAADGSVSAPTPKISKPRRTAAKADAPKRAIKIIKAAKPASTGDSAIASPVPVSHAAPKAEVPVVEPFETKAEPVVETAKAAASPKKAAKKPAAKTKAPKAAASAAKTPAKRAVKDAKPRAPRKAKVATVIAADTTTETAVNAIPELPAVETSPVFQALADVSLPKLDRENRARLLMQSPTRLYLYWAVREDPWQQLKKVFGGDAGGYMLVLKLIDRTHNIEEIHRADAAGNWWFEVEADSEYQAEIGFYSPNRPYFRILYSNKVATPRRSPSLHPSSEARWTISANKFAEVLDASGFARDAFDVALIGDDHERALDAGRTALAKMVGVEFISDGISAEDIRFALLSLATGMTLDELRHRIGAELFAILGSTPERATSAGARTALNEHFGIADEEWTEYEIGPQVFGSSLVHFPKSLKPRKPTLRHSPRYNPVSSFRLG